MNRKAIITTLLVIQLILLVLLTFSVLKYQKNTYQDAINVRSVAAARMVSYFNAIGYDIGYLKCRGADNETLNNYTYFVRITFNNYSGAQITLNSTYMAIKDSGLEMQKISNLNMVGNTTSWQGMCYSKWNFNP